MMFILLNIEQQYKTFLEEGGFPYHMIIVVLIIGGWFFFLINRKIKSIKEEKEAEEERRIDEKLRAEAVLLTKKEEQRIALEKEKALIAKSAEEEAERFKIETEKLIINTSTNPTNQVKSNPNQTKIPTVELELIFTEPTIKREIIGPEEIVTIESKASVSNEIKRIGYVPSTLFNQDGIYNYPVALMPLIDSKIKFPRKGRSNKIGFKEPALFEALKNEIGEFYRVLNDRHVPTSSNSRPYEPDLVLINEKDGKNIFINVEIDEPYEAYSRTPTHEIGTDNSRDEFFTTRGWLVIKFTEKQVHEQLIGCVNFIKKIIASVDDSFVLGNILSDRVNLIIEPQWDELQSKKWAKEFYRERYLGITNFGARPNIRYEYIISNSELDLKVEKSIKKIPQVNLGDDVKDTLSIINVEERDNRIAFDSEKHKYFIDGNADTISVTELIAKFFPTFDSDYWSKHKAFQRGVNQSVVLAEWEANRVASADAGTLLHKEIENYYNGLPYNSDLLEFQHFLSFVNTYKNMKPFRSEWRIFDEDLLIAGTVDMVFQKEGNELYMFDWKRSEKVVDAYGKIKNPTYDFAFGELSHLGDSSFNKYALQQNIYKHILEKRYGKKITSMNLLIMHPNFETYHIVKLPDMNKEVKYILEASKNYK
jgi:hypothetical protein